MALARRGSGCKQINRVPGQRCLSCSKMRTSAGNVISRVPPIAGRPGRGVPGHIKGAFAPLTPRFACRRFPRRLPPTLEDPSSLRRPYPGERRFPGVSVRAARDAPRCPSTGRPRPARSSVDDTVRTAIMQWARRLRFFVGSNLASVTPAAILRAYREAEYKDAIHEAANAVESTMKVLLDEQGITHPCSRTAASAIVALAVSLPPAAGASPTSPEIA